MTLSQYARSLFVALILAACSIELSGTTPGGTPAPVGSETRPGPAESRQATPAPVYVPQPLPWAHLNLTGQVIFTRGTQGISRLNLTTGEITVVFDPPGSGWIIGASASPDGNLLATAYTPPPPLGQALTGYTSLYLIPADGSGEASPLRERTAAQESFFTPVWSPDGAFLYYTHLLSVPSERGSSYRYVIERLAPPDGPSEIVVEGASWPRLSPDSSKLVYVTMDAFTLANDLYVANADGSEAVRLTSAEDFAAVDAPFFSPDGQWVIFSATGAAASASLNWLDQLLGVRTASAHSVPSDWWRIPVGGGSPERLTFVYQTGLYGAVAPDGRHIAFSSIDGVFIMPMPRPQDNPRLGAADIVRLLRTPVIGTVDWTP